jgi:hypothetical protein
MVEGPRARTANAQDFLEFLEEVVRPGTRDHLVATLPREVVDVVVGGARTDWTPIALDGIYVTAIVRWLGEDAARDAWRAFTGQRFVKSPAIRALAEGAVRLFGVSVAAFVRRLPLAYQQSFRDFGAVRVDEGDREATVTIEDLAASGRHFEGYAVLFHGLFLGIYDIVGVEPRLDYRVDTRSRAIRARFRW